MKAGIIIDSWKLPIFSRLLVKAGYHYTQNPGIVEDTYLLTVEVDSKSYAGLQDTVVAARLECAETGDKHDR